MLAILDVTIISVLFFSFHVWSMLLLLMCCSIGFMPDIKIYIYIHNLLFTFLGFFFLPGFCLFFQLGYLQHQINGTKSNC